MQNVIMEKIFLFRTSIRTLRRYMCTPPTGSKQPPSGTIAPRYKPSEFQKFILVWTKKYKNKDEIPTYISSELITRSRSEARIKLANILMVLTVLGSIAAIYLGKAAVKRGESVHQMNLDWHKKYEEDYKKKEAEAKKV